MNFFSLRNIREEKEQTKWHDCKPPLPLVWETSTHRTCVSLMKAKDSRNSVFTASPSWHCDLGAVGCLGWQGHAPVPDPCKKAVLHPGWCMPLPPASQVQSCPASDCATSPALVNWSLEDRQGEKMCFYSCHTCKTAVTRGYAGSMGFSFGLKGEISVQSGDLLQGISCRALAANPAANGAAAARRLLSPRVQSGKLALNEQRKTCLATIWPFASLFHAPHNNSSSCNQPPSVRT